MDGLAIAVSAASIVGAVITFLRFYQTFSDRISKVKDDAKQDVDQLRAEREKAGSDIASQIAAVHAQQSLFRETVAREQREFVTREMLRDFEQRIERTMRENAQQMVGAIETLTNRVDRVIEDRPARASRK